MSENDSTANHADQRVYHALNAIGWKFTVDGAYAAVPFSITQDRSIVAYINSNTFVSSTGEMRELSTPLFIDQATWNFNIMRFMLLQNQQQTVGAWGIAHPQEDNMTAIFAVYVPSNIDPEGLKAAIEFSVAIVDDLTLMVYPPGGPKRVDLSGISPEAASRPNPKLAGGK
jgi:hypothetical protein